MTLDSILDETLGISHGKALDGTLEITLGCDS